MCWRFAGTCASGCPTDLEELLAERGVEVDHVTIYRGALRFTPLLADATRPCRHALGDRWQVDETYVKVAGQWRYVYRAIDQFGQVVDVLVSARRDATAARRFFQRAISVTRVTPVEVTTDQAPVGTVALTGIRRGSPAKLRLSFMEGRQEGVEPLDRAMICRR